MVEKIKEIKNRLENFQIFGLYVFQDHFIKSSLIVFISTALSNVFALLYQLYLVRRIEPVDYGLLNSFIAFVNIVLIFANSFQTALTNFISKFFGLMQFDKIRYFLRRLTKQILIFSIIFLLLVIFSSKNIANFLKTQSILPVIITAFILLSAFLFSIPQGALTGIQEFLKLAINVNFNSCSRLIIGILLVAFGFGINGALSGFMISNILTMFLSYAQIKKYFKKSSVEQSSVKIDFKEFYKYFFPVTVTLVCFMIMTNIDVILVRHYFVDLEAGHYSIAQLVGKIVLFFPMAINVVMFPQISSLHAQNQETSHILKKGIYITLLLCAIVSSVIFIFPSFVLKFIAGKIYIDCLDLIKIFAISMSLFSFVNLFLYYHLSKNEWKFIYPLIGLVILEIILINLFHNSLRQVLYVLCIIPALFLIGQVNIFRKNV